MKKSIILLLILFMCSGCTRIDNCDINIIVDNVLKNNIKTNASSMGYTYYLPVGTKKILDKDFNQKIKLGNNYLYMYVDIVSFYYKNDINFNDSEGSCFYFKRLNKNDKKGYIKITEEDKDDFFVKIVFNYGKIETHVNKVQLNETIANSLTILDSIDYNEKLIKNIIDEEYSIGSTKDYKIKKPKDAKSKYSEYLSEYVQNEEEIPKLPEY